MSDELNEALPPVKRIEMVSFASGYEEPAPSMFRVMVSGICADFETETAANNMRNAILALLSPAATPWKPIETFDGMDLLDQVDLWLVIHPSPRSIGWGDAFRVIEAYRRKGKWFHSHNGKEAELNSDYITHWMKPIEGPPADSPVSRPDRA